MDEIPANIRVNSYNALCRIAKDNMVAEPMQRTVKVFWGKTGTGKSRRAWEEAGWDAYPKIPSTKFWDGYQDQPNIVIDDTQQGPGGVAAIYIRGIGVGDVEKSVDPAVGVGHGVVVVTHGVALVL